MTLMERLFNRMEMGGVEIGFDRVKIYFLVSDLLRIVLIESNYLNVDGTKKREDL